MKSLLDIVGVHHDSFESIIKEIDLRILNGAFIGYAQNKEDVYINRLFSSIRNGFYVDVVASILSLNPLHVPCIEEVGVVLILMLQSQILTNLSLKGQMT